LYIQIFVWHSAERPNARECSIREIVVRGLDVKLSVVRIISGAFDIDEISNMASLEVIEKFISSLEDNQQEGYFYLTFFGHELQSLIDAESSKVKSIRNLCKQGKMFVGPWYSTPNDCLANGESILRNLLFGNRIGRRICSVMKIGFSALDCNNNSQLPQIFNGFNIDTLFVPVQRSQHIPAEFYWEGSDGSRALGISNYMVNLNLLSDYSILDEMINGILNEDNYPNIPIMMVENISSFGKSHRFSEVIDYLRALPEIEVEQISLPDYFWNIKETVSKHSIKTLTREAIPNISGEHNEQNPECLYIMVKNSQIQHKLQYYLEPWDIIRMKTVGESEHSEIESLWKQLLRMQTVINENMDLESPDKKQKIRRKFYGILKQVNTIYTNSINDIIEHIKHPDDDKNGYFCVINPLPHQRTQVVSFDVELPADIALENIAVEDFSGNNIPCVTLQKSEISSLFTDDGSHQQKYHCIAEFNNLPALGYRTYKVIPVRKQVETHHKNIISVDNELENDFVRVVINKTGTFSVYSKETGVTYESLCIFTDTHFDKEGGVEVIPRITQIENSSLKGACKIEYVWSCSGDKNQTRATAIFSLNRLSRAVDIDIDIVDKANGHDIECRFPINFKIDHIYSDSRFDIQDVLPLRGIRHLSQSRISLNTLIGVCDEIEGFALISKELRKAYVTIGKRSYIAFKLVNRCDDRNPGNGGPAIYHYSFAFIPYIGGWENGQILREAYNKIFDVKTYMLTRGNGDLPEQMEFLNISPSSLSFSAMKSSENNNVILRLFNPSIEYIEGTITTYYSLDTVYSMSLEEYRIEPVRLKNDHTIQLLIPPKKIVTLEMVFAE